MLWIDSKWVINNCCWVSCGQDIYESLGWKCIKIWKNSALAWVSEFSLYFKEPVTESHSDVFSKKKLGPKSKNS